MFARFRRRVDVRGLVVGDRVARYGTHQWELTVMGERQERDRLLTSHGGWVFLRSGRHAAGWTRPQLDQIFASHRAHMNGETNV